MRIQSTIRFALPKDIDQIVELCKRHADYERAEYDRKGKSKKLATALFSDSPPLYCLVVESDGQLLGYATYMVQYATWDAENYIYLDCIYLKEYARGLGIGKKLINRIKAEGKALKCGLMQWQTPDFNTRAITFYKRLGATSKTKERFFLSW
ncbi:MAG: GNAT family N-acetyltransferase [Bacteroidota bacterium]|nr:GNAT family N-acetyltransferase [uncultured Allomuricauda sp.]